MKVVGWLLGWALLMSAGSGVAWGAEAESGWIKAETPSKRFFGEPTVGPVFDAGARVVVLSRDGGEVRVQQGDRFGWVAASAVTAEAPAGAPGMPPALVIPAQ